MHASSGERDVSGRERIISGPAGANKEESTVTEPEIVVENREHLWYLLSEASQLEHMIMCEYLFAGFTLKREADEGLSPDEAAAVAEWRSTLREIAAQEMLHLALVANVTAAI